MSTSITAALGILFVALSVVTTALMFQFWGYPYDKQARKSSCPKWKMNIHRACGYAYALVYALMMFEMVPRMWEYQVELPARTVAHLLLGMTIGALLVIKLSILRFFRHFEEWMPVLGTLLFVCTLLLAGLSLPFSLKERALVAAAPGGSAFSAESQQRVARLLPGAELPDEVDLASLATADALTRGRQVLLEQCVQCHDLKTVIARPRTPEDWWRTVDRMAQKPTLGQLLGPQASYEVTAFLIAITPDLQASAKQRREGQVAQQQAQAAMAEAEPGMVAEAEPEVAVDLTKAKGVFEDKCSLCHDTSDVDDEPPATAEEAAALVERMVDNGMQATADELALIDAYLRATYVKAE